MTGTPIEQATKRTKKAAGKRKRKAKGKAQPEVKRPPGRPRKPKEPPPEGWITRLEFIKLIDAPMSALDYAVKRGRVTAFGKFGPALFFDPVKAKEEWENNANQKQRANAKGRDSETFNQYLEQKKAEIAEYANIDYDKIPAIEAERREKVYKAKLAEIKFLEQSGKLIEVEVVRSTWFELARKVRDAIAQIPPRLAPELASETSPHKLETRLAKELNAALERLSEKHGVVHVTG